MPINFKKNYVIILISFLLVMLATLVIARKTIFQPSLMEENPSVIEQYPVSQPVASDEAQNKDTAKSIELIGAVVEIKKNNEKNSFIRLALKDGNVFSVGVFPETKITLDGEVLDISSLKPFSKVAVIIKENPQIAIKYDYVAESISIFKESENGNVPEMNEKLMMPMNVK